MNRPGYCHPWRRHRLTCQRHVAWSTSLGHLERMARPLRRVLTKDAGTVQVETVGMECSGLSVGTQRWMVGGADQGAWMERASAVLLPSGGIGMRRPLTEVLVYSLEDRPVRLQ